MLDTNRKNRKHWDLKPAILTRKRVFVTAVTRSGQGQRLQFIYKRVNYSAVYVYREKGSRGEEVIHTLSSLATLVLISTHAATHRNHREGSVNRSGKLYAQNTG